LYPNKELLCGFGGVLGISPGGMLSG